MPLAALLPLGIITAALGVAGVGLSGTHYLFTGEVRPPRAVVRMQRLRERSWDASTPHSPRGSFDVGGDGRPGIAISLPPPPHPVVRSPEAASLCMPPSLLTRLAPRPVQRNKPMTDRWKEALYDRDRMIKHHYG
jgi:hypothetical protein